MKRALPLLLLSLPLLLTSTDAHAAKAKAKPPERVLGESDESDWVLGSTSSSSEWSWDDFAGEDQWYVPRCDEEGGSPEEGGTATAKPGDPDAATGYVYAPIPQVSVPAGYAAKDWDWPLGKCSLRVDGTPGKGYTTFGKFDAPSAELDSSFQAVFIDDDTLVVDVTDDHLTSGSAKRILDDHLELWLADGGSPGFDQEQCLTGEEPRAQQWGSAPSIRWRAARSTCASRSCCRRAGIG